MTGAFRADVSHDASVELRLQVEPARLPPLGVGVEAREDLLDRVGFYKRMARGIGYFRSPEDLKAMGLEFSAALFDGIPGIRANDSAVVSLSHASGMSRCPLHVAVDGVVIAGSWREIVDPHEVLALEVYPRPTGLPVWLAGSVSPCGAVVIWTKR